MRRILAIAAVALVMPATALGSHAPKPGNRCYGHLPPKGYVVKKIWPDGSAIAQRVEVRRHLRFLWQTNRNAKTCKWSTPRIMGRQ